MMPRFEIYTIIAAICLGMSMAFINENNLIVAVGLSIISLIPTLLVKRELENAKWGITFWSKLLPTVLSIFIFLVFLLLIFWTLTKLMGNFNLSNIITLLIAIFDDGIGFFLVYTYIFSKPNNALPETARV